MEIIFACENHIDLVAEILCDDWLDSIEKAKNEMLERVNNKECLIAIEGDEVLGVLLYSKDYSHDANYCKNLFVSKNHRRKGIGVALLKRFIEMSRKEQRKDQKYVLGSANEANIGSIHAYKKTGFKELGVIKNLHYGKDEIFFGYELW